MPPSARDDYLLLALHADDELAPPFKRGEIRAALDEIDHLRRWKREATEVLQAWDDTYEALGRRGRLGQSKPEAVREAFAAEAGHRTR